MSYNNEYPWRNKELMKRLYNEDKLSHAQIGEKLGCGQPTITVWMDKHGIEPRPTPLATAMAKGPLSLNVNKDGYEVFQTRIDRNGHTILHHRLLAVAIYGFDAVKDKVVHHKNNISWDNRSDNIKLKTDSKHKHDHAIEFWKREDYRKQQMENSKNADRDEKGRFA